MISLNQNFKLKFNVYFLFIYLFIHKPETVKPKCYKEQILSRFSGVLSTGVSSIFIQGGRKSDIMGVLY